MIQRIGMDKYLIEGRFLIKTMLDTLTGLVTVDAMDVKGRCGDVSFSVPWYQLGDALAVIEEWAEGYTP